MVVFLTYPIKDRLVFLSKNSETFQFNIKFMFTPKSSYAFQVNHVYRYTFKAVEAIHLVLCTHGGEGLIQVHMLAYGGLLIMYICIGNRGGVKSIICVYCNHARLWMTCMQPYQNKAVICLTGFSQHSSLLAYIRHLNYLKSCSLIFL